MEMCHLPYIAYYTGAFILGLFRSHHEKADGPERVGQGPGLVVGQVDLICCPLTVYCGVIIMGAVKLPLGML